jgi:hypothetical protein
MDLIRRLIPLPILFSFPFSALAYTRTERTSGLASFLYAFIAIHVFLGILFFYLNTEFFYLFITEDSYIEYLTALLLLLAVALCVYKASREERRLPKLFFLASAFLLFFGLGEEISWAQRIVGFDTPDNLEKINAQQEFNLHNIHVGGVNLNKLIFGKILYTGVFIYFLVFPLLYWSKRWVSSLIDKFAIPVPSLLQSSLYMLFFFATLLIRDGEMWEMQEFILAGFIVALYMTPNNKIVADETV